MVDAHLYELDAHEIREIFDARIRPEWFPPQSSPTPGQPAIVLLGGQPGAGKSLATQRIIGMYEDARMVAVTGDDFKRFHPHYHRLLRQAPLQMPDITDQASGPWVVMSKDYARDHGRSFLLEGTFHTPEVTLSTAQEFSDRDFQTHIVALAVPRHVSLLDAADRYFRDHAHGRAARFTSAQRHDRGFEGTAAMMDAVRPSPYVDRVSVLTRSGEVLFNAVRDVPGRPGREFDGARAALDAGRAAELTPVGAGEWLDRLENIASYARSSGQINADTRALFRPLYRTGAQVVVDQLGLAADDPQRQAYADTLRRGAIAVGIRDDVSESRADRVERLVRPRPVRGQGRDTDRPGPRHGGPQL